MSTHKIVLGYTVGGEREPAGMQVDIPLGHMAVTGQTQASGKTTTLEALISRSKVRAWPLLPSEVRAALPARGGSIRIFVSKQTGSLLPASLRPAVVRS